MTTQAEYDAELAQEISRFYADPLGYVMFAFPWGEPGGPLESFDGPDTWQKVLLSRLGDEIKARNFNGVDPVAPIWMSTSSGHGVGKHHNKSMMLDTPDGYRRWGDIQPGDKVFGADGSPVTVLQTHEQGVKPLYKVTFDDGSFTYAGAEHLWNVRGRQERRKGLDTWRTLSTEQILEIGVQRKNGVAMAKQWEVPIQGPAQFPEQEIDIHPYVLGVWIGDGSKGHPVFTKPYPELTDRVRDLGYEVVARGDGKTKAIRGVAHLFPKNLFCKSSHERFIPDSYKYNTVENRRELLRGLLDTDGEVHHSGSIGYSTTSRQLAEDVLWLVRSLGGKAIPQAAVKLAWYPDPVTGERVECRDCFRITINLDWNPFTLKHRKDKYKPSEARYTKRWIESIEYSHDEEAMCISVDAPDHLYLANDFIVTHNSALTSWLILFVLSTRPNAKIIVTAGTINQLADKTFAELGKWKKHAINGHWFEYRNTRGNLALFRPEAREAWFASGQASTKENADSFAGLHNAQSTACIIYDEASAVPAEIFEVGLGSQTDGEPMMFLFGNPTRNTGFFADTFGRLRHRWITWQVDSRTAKMTNKSLIQEWVDDYGEDSDFVRVRVKGEFPRVGDAQFISTEVVEQARARTVEPVATDPIILGVDVARFGEDQSVLTVIHGRRLVTARAYRELDLMELSARVIELIKEFKPHAVFIDGAGVGAGVVDRLRLLQYKVIEVQAGAKAEDEEHYRNKRAEMWGRMRDWLKEADIPNEYLALQYDLTGITYSYDDKMRICLEKKSDMKKRGLASPDWADSLALCHAEPVNPVSKAKHYDWQKKNRRELNWRTL